MPTISSSFENSPLRRNEITRNVTKKIAAVPKSPISPRQPKQNAANPMKIHRFFFSNNSSSDAAPIQMNATLTSSDGWKLTGPIASQFFAP